MMRVNGVVWCGVMAVAALLGGCGAPATTITGGAVIQPGSAARLVLTGSSPSMSLSSDAAVALPLEMQSQQQWMGTQRVQPTTDTLEPGVTRWWRLSGGTMVLIRNPGTAAATVQYTVQNGSISMRMGE